MLYYKILSLILVQVVCTIQFQVPFSLGSWPEKTSQQHYSQIDSKDHPVNLNQYKDDYLIRIDYASNPDLGKYLITNNGTIKFNKWNKNVKQQTIDIQINEDNMSKLLQEFNNDVNFKVIIEDLSQTVFETYPKNLIQTKDEDVLINSELFFQDYRNLETIDAWLELIQLTYPDIINIEEIGETYEHRKYKIVHFTVPSEQTLDGHGDRRTIVITGGVHAREWISVSSVLYSIYELIELYKIDPQSKIFRDLDFIFIPVFNPDGYEYTWTTDRLWRKNRQDTVHPRCFGIDIDHSFGYHWTKSSDWACGDEYSGEEPFEALEAKIWEEYLNNTNSDHKIWGFIDLHSYAEEILYPYAFSCKEQPRDEENLLELAWGLAKAIRMQSGTNYQVFAACLDRDADLLPDLGAGTALDYMYHNRAYFAYQLKLRDTGNHGFLLPPKEIVPVGREVVASLKYLFHFLVDQD
ncbi:ECM14 Inactive metallocarboxypeptidase ECM14 [Candida maltosa Xu316]|uniref:Inactive metallocarboxypeptidase ECM14 n=1 Tax=Candida maltosa (strain Xu316) TaxID=1245528 RepID=M3K6C1_CANMX|nr:Extracellular matrix protein 14 [Candida maltosa Xu316]